MKRFTDEEIIKKHQTNMKSADTVLLLTGVLGLICVMRYITKGSLDYFFGFGFVRIFLHLYDIGRITLLSTVLPVVLFLGCYLAFSALSMKNKRWYLACLCLYCFDFAALLILQLIIAPVSPFPAENFIDIIFHAFILLFVSVGLYSHKKLSAKGETAQ